MGGEYKGKARREIGIGDWIDAERGEKGKEIGAVGERGKTDVDAVVVVVGRYSLHEKASASQTIRTGSIHLTNFDDPLLKRVSVSSP